VDRADDLPAQLDDATVVEQRERVGQRVVDLTAELQILVTTTVTGMPSSAPW